MSGLPPHVRSCDKTWLLRRENGVTDGTRTRDSQNHNLELYQLSYGHQPCEER